MSRSIPGTWFLTCIALVACSDSGTGTTSSSGGSSGASTTASSSGSTSSSGETSSGTVGADGCGANVTIAFFSDDACTAQVGQRTYKTGMECFSWTAAGSNAQDNSATRFQCYRDRICYTQHPSTLTCTNANPGPTDKEARVGECVKEPSGSLYSKVLSGTESCPEAPAGFSCPASAAGAGTAAIAACSSAAK